MQEVAHFSDQISLDRIKTLRKEIQTDVESIFLEAWSRDLFFRISQAFRSPKDQHELFRIGRDIKGKIVTNSDSWESWHNYGLAFDIVLLSKDKKSVIWDVKADLNKNRMPDLVEFVEIAKKHGFKWGGEFKTFIDRPHFEKTFGLKIAYMKKQAFLGKLEQIKI